MSSPSWTISESRPPSRFTEASFRRFEPTIMQVLSVYPEDYVFRPRTLSCETTVCRIRDAVRAYMESEWKSTIDKALLKSIWPSVTLSHDGRAVRIGKPKRLLKGLETEQLQTGGTVRELVVRDASLEVIHAFATIYSEGALQFPTRFLDLTDNPSLTQITAAILNVPNVQFFQDKSDYLML